MSRQSAVYRMYHDAQAFRQALRDGRTDLLYSYQKYYRQPDFLSTANLLFSQAYPDEISQVLSPQRRRWLVEQHRDLMRRLARLQELTEELVAEYPRAPLDRQEEIQNLLIKNRTTIGELDDASLIDRVDTIIYEPLTAEMEAFANRYR